LRVVASRDHAGPVVSRLLATNPGMHTVSIGSSLKFCLVAEGRADLYLRDGPTMVWDTAAGQAVLEAAGGGVFTLSGAPLSGAVPELRNPQFIAVGALDLPWQELLAASSRPSDHEA
jgi:3'(2'), 5'-bisphosphate nucleotidase